MKKYANEKDNLFSVLLQQQTDKTHFLKDFKVLPATKSSFYANFEKHKCHAHKFLIFYLNKV